MSHHEQNRKSGGSWLAAGSDAGGRTRRRMRAVATLTSQVQRRFADEDDVPDPDLPDPDLPDRDLPDCDLPDRRRLGPGVQRQYWGPLARRPGCFPATSVWRLKA